MNTFLMRHPPIDPAWHHHCLGHSDAPLSEKVIAQLDEWAEAVEWIRPDEVRSSDLQRCRRPAERIAERLGLPLHCSPIWRELDFGRWDGEPWSRIHEKEPSRLTQWAAEFVDRPPPGGESLRALSRRVQTAFDTIPLHPGKTCLVITHGGFIRTACCRLTGMPPARAFDWEIDYGTIVKCRWTGAAWTLDSLHGPPELGNIRPALPHDP